MTFVPADVLKFTSAELRQLLRAPLSKISCLRNTPTPLIRAVQLEDQEAFVSWLRWGCNLNAPSIYATPDRYAISYRTALADLAALHPRWLQWVVEHNPEQISKIIEGLQDDRSRLDWSVVTGHRNFTQEHASMLFYASLAHSQPLVDVEKLVKKCGGHIAPCPLMANLFAWNEYARLEKDIKGYETLNRLSVGLLKSCDVKWLVKKHLFLTAFMACEQMSMSADDGEYAPPKCKVPKWFDLVGTLNGVGRYKHISVHDLSHFLLRTLDTTSTDYQKNTALVLPASLSSWPLDVRLEMARVIWEKKPILLEQKNKEGKALAEAFPNNQVVQELQGWASHQKLTTVVKTQTRKMAKPKEAPPPTRRKM